MKEYRNPPDVHAPLAAYSHQIEISGPERLLILSGQVGAGLDGAVPDDPAGQLGAALASPACKVEIDAWASREY
jgi:2-iminobutanoate/2-iminopropanoate deaminase